MDALHSDQLQLEFADEILDVRCVLRSLIDLWRKPGGTEADSQRRREFAAAAQELLDRN